MSNNSQFRRGQSTFKCGCCGRLTRHTGVQSLGSQTCPQCYELAGIYNAYQDGEDVAKYAIAIRAYALEIVAKGGWPDGDAFELLALIDGPGVRQAAFAAGMCDSDPASGAAVTR